MEEDPFNSSGELSELTNAEDINVVTPTCPICHQHYTCRVKPVTIQPCGHGVCNTCVDKLEEHGSLDNPSLCPLCRGPIESIKPNFDLREITNNINVDSKLGFWESQIKKMTNVQGKKISFSREMRFYSKAICIRLAYDDTFSSMKMPSSVWSSEDMNAIRAMKNALTEAALMSDDNVDVVVLWLSILAFPIPVEDYLIRFILKWFESKEYLDQLNGTWLLSVLTQPV